MTLSPTIKEDGELPDIPTLFDLLAATSEHFDSQSLDTNAYLGHLTALPLSSLQAEPTTLSSSSAQLTNALTTLCYTSYPTFLSLHSTTTTLVSSLSTLSSSLDSILSTLPSLESSSRTFAQETRNIQKDRRKSSLILEHHDKLHDILSLPILLDSCIRNHNYNEALMLASHSSALSKRFPDNPLIESIRAECDARIQVMLAQLLGALSEQAKLPMLFRSVNFIRKMEVLDEEELALAFLSGRGGYLDGALNATESERGAHLEGQKDEKKDAYAKYLKKYVDVWREGVQDVVTQYTTIFLDRALSTSSLSTPTRLHSLLSAFASHYIQNLLFVLRGTLPTLSHPIYLTPLLTQLTYCSNSFARLGLDFKAFVVPIFVDAVRIGIIQELDEAAESWCSPLFPPTASATKPSTSSKKPSQFLIAPSSLSAPPRATPVQIQTALSGPVNIPPQILASYPHLAFYLNAILTALNSFRMLAPVELMSEILTHLEGILARGGQSLIQYGGGRLWHTHQNIPASDPDDKEGDVVEATTEAYFTVFVPFVRRALIEGVYSEFSDNIQSTSAELEAVVTEWRESLATQSDS